MKIRKTIRYIMYTYHVKEMMFVNTSRKTILKFGIYLVLLSVAVVIALIPNLLSYSKQTLPRRHAKFPTDLRYILFWSQPKRNKKSYYVKEKPEYDSGQSMFIRQNCPFINCYITYNKTLLRSNEDFDAVVFNVEDINKLDTIDFDLTRSSFQKYIFKSFESSENHPICNPAFDVFFNWTWTYRLDSDIPYPFFNIYEENNKLVGPKKKIHWILKMKHTDRFKNKVLGKDRAVAWIVSKCKQKIKHQDFIKDLTDELKGYNYSLDTYGPCSRNKCPEGKIYKCHKMIEKRYFFQLVLEDTFAEDYVSEKLVKAMTHITLPIVFGGANYTSFLPPGSYINAQAFDMKKLGAIIDHLIKNHKTYEYFFDWKNHYYYTARSKSNICDLCAKLNSNDSFVEKSHSNFRLWWNPDYKDVCQRMQLLSLFGNR